MLIEAGFDIAFECPAQTPMLLQLNVHPSRDADLLTPDRIASDPPLAMRAYLDLFGNRVTRVEVPAGLVTFSNRFVIHELGRAGRNAARCEDDADRRPSRRRAAVPGFKPILRQRQARRFRLVAVRKAVRRHEGRAGDLRFRSRENPLQLRGCALDPLRQRFHARRHRRLPRLRPSRHRALPLHEHSRPLLHRLSRRHWRSGRYQPHGFQRLGRGLSRRALVDDGRASQPSPHRPHCHGTRPRRRRRRDVDRLRRRQPRAL